MKRILYLLLSITLTLCLPPAQAGENVAGSSGTVFFVTNTADSGAGSLRQAITDSNVSGTASTILFDIPGDGPHVIAPATLLPALTVPTTVDGLSQNGADCTTWPPTLKIELSGANLTAGGTYGLRLFAGSAGSVVRGLVIRDFDNSNTSAGLLISSDANHIACNFIGTDVTGTAASGNTRGITLSSSQANVIGTAAGWSGRHERNLISGNVNIGIITVGNGTSNNRISGNWIGTDVTGTGALGGSFGITIGAPGGTPTENIVIGYDGAGDPLLMRNVISGHSAAGINLGNNTRRVHVAGNYIGLNAEGAAAVPNSLGIDSIAGSAAAPRLYHLIGWDGTPGQRTNQRNVISGNVVHGVSISFFNNTGNDHAVVGNWIGTDAQGQAAIPNGLYGVSLAGGSAPTRVLVHGNRITGNASGGIQLFANSSNQHPMFWNGVDIPELPNLDSTDNCITDNGAGIARRGSGPAIAVTFIENWWGATDGPSGSGGGSGDSIPGAVTYQPFLDLPPEHCGDLPVAPALHLSPTSLDFGDVEVNSTADMPVTLQNLGNATASPLGLVVSGPGFDFNPGNCGPDLAPGASCQLTVSFTPNQNGPVSGSMQVNVAGVEQTQMDLSGNGVWTISPDENDILYVDQSVTGGDGSGDSWTNAVPELSIALAWAAADWDPDDGDLQIWVAEGTYRPTDDNSNLEASFVLVDEVALYGGFAGVETSLDERDWADHPTVLSGEVDGSHVYNVLFASGVGPDTVVDGFIVTGGHATSTAGGIPALGGGMHLIDSGPVLSNIIFTGNRARSGGAAYLDQSLPLFINVLFFDNEAVAFGGGGVYNNVNSHATYINCVFYGNSARDTLFQSAAGGGMYNFNGSSPEIVNSIFWGNTADIGEDQIHGPDGEFGGFTNEARISYSVIEGGMPENSIDEGHNQFADPLFTDAAGGDFSLQRESSAVNAGDPDTDLSLFHGGPDNPVDLAGNPRVFPGIEQIIDIGTYELQDDPPAPQLSFDPSNLDFGEVEIDTGGASLSAILHNTGDADATGLELSLAGGTDFSITGGDCAAILSAEDSCQVEVTFLPTEIGQANTTLIAAGNESTALAELELTGTGTQPGLQLTPDNLDFGDIPVDETSTPAAVTLASTGTAALVIDDLLGPEAPFMPAGNGGDRGLQCGAPPFTLEPGQSCDLLFQFSPDAIGDAGSTLTVIGNAPSSPDEVVLTGRGVAAFIEPDPGSFTLELVTGQSDTRSLTIENSGNIDLDWTVSAASSCGGSGVGWLSADPISGTTGPESITPIEIAIDAADLSAGTFEAVLCIASNAHGAPQLSVPVSLTVTAPSLVFDPPELGFGDVEVDTASAPMTALLHNGGDADATGLDFLIPAGFDADTGDCGTTLPVGESCEIAVTFTPSETGTAEGLLIAGAAGEAMAELALTGNGTEAGALSVEPGQLHFENVAVSTARIAEFTVLNTGGSDLELSAVTLKSGGPAFAVHDNGCPSGTVLAPEDSCIVEISFTPDEVAPYEGAVRVTTGNGQQATVALSGNGAGDEIFGDRFEQP